MHRFTGLITRFRRDERGAFAVMFGLMAVVLIAMGGAVVDYVTLEQTRNRAQIALDAAALALQPEIFEDTPDAEQIRKSAEDLVINRIGDSTIQISVDPVTINVEQGSLYLRARMTVPTLFITLVGVDELTAQIQSEAARGSLDLEISVALDLTGSMSGQRIIDLQDAMHELIDTVVQDDQDPNTSRMALVPYSQGVNVAGYATSIRGPIRSYRSASGMAWSTGNWKTITNATHANPVVITSNGHGFADGDWVYIRSVTGMTQINNRAYQVAGRTNNTFQLSGVNGSGPSYGFYSGNGRVMKCLFANCNVQVTSNGHGFSNNEWIHVTNVGGLTGLNNQTFQASNVTVNTLILQNSPGALTPTGTYTNNTGQLHCTWQTATEGCTYYRYLNPSNAARVFPVTTCVTERAVNGTNDTPPSTTYAGRNYPPTGNGCLNDGIMPLTDDKFALHDAIDDYNVAGSTAGQLGIVWSWYMLSPEFGYLWPDSQPEEYEAPNLLKAAVLMTDGEFNTVHCNGAIAQNSGTGSGSTSDYINCNAHNGSAYVQARAYCDAMKAEDVGIVIFTVGFGIVEGSGAADVLTYCASGEDNAFLAEDGDELSDAFQQIARNISQLRLSQ